MKTIKHKRGEVREDGKIFWAYAASAKNGEWWLSQERYAIRLQRLSISEKSEARKNYRRAWAKVRYRTNAEFNQKAKQESLKRYSRLKATGKLSSLRKSAHAKRMTNPIYYLQHISRARLAAALSSRGWKKIGKTSSMIGCTYAELRAHIESQFQDGMSWDNKGNGGWEVDHIIPLSSAKTPEDIQRLSHYTNLQPLWQQHNKTKGNKI